METSNDDRKKRPRTAFSAAQIKALEGEFERGKYLSVAKRTALAKQLHLTETQVPFFHHFSLKMILKVRFHRLRFGSKTVGQNGNANTHLTLKHLPLTTTPS